MYRVILIGDSIAMAYGPVVRELLAGWAEVWQPEENGGTSANVLAHLQEWALRRPADLMHLNCGLHDLAIDPGAAGPRLTPEVYGENLIALRRGLEAGTTARLIWATTTPVVDAWHEAVKGFRRHARDVLRYNQVAREAMAGLPVNDLHALITTAGLEQCICEDGVHMTDHGNRLLAEAVARHVRNWLCPARRRAQSGGLT